MPLQWPYLTLVPFQGGWLARGGLGCPQSQEAQGPIGLSVSWSSEIRVERAAVFSWARSTKGCEVKAFPSFKEQIQPSSSVFWELAVVDVFTVVILARYN